MDEMVLDIFTILGFTTEHPPSPLFDDCDLSRKVLRVFNIDLGGGQLEASISSYLKSEFVA